MNWHNLSPKLKLTLGVILPLIFIAVIILISATTIISRSGKTKVTIAIEPKNAQVFLDGNNKNINNSDVYLSNEKHTFFIFLDGYIYQEINLQVNEYNSSVITQLTPIASSSLSTSGQHVVSDEKELAAEKQTLEKLEAKFPIITYLPYNPANATFGITYDFNESYTELTININPKSKDNAIALNTACDTLKKFNRNISLSPYNIIVNNFTNILDNKFQPNSAADPMEFLKTGYASVKNLYIQEGDSNGDYYYTVIENTIPIPESDKTDYIPYRAILKKQGNSWTLVNTPTLLLTNYNTPGVPENIIDAANFYNNRSQNEKTR